jgi:AraC family transcriptional regulator of adaptative response/methylated-DNA-[protein]-cysteine methyltransferase
VTFHASCREAEAAGFRPCKRCRPNAAGLQEENAARIARACRLIESADDAPRLTDLARDAGLSPYHFHRVFKACTGLTPKAYTIAHRHKRVRAALKDSKTVTQALFAAGFSSSAKFYGEAATMLGMTPERYRKGGAQTELAFATRPCSLGAVLVATTEKGIAAILLGDDDADLRRELEARFPRARLVRGGRDFEQVIGEVVAFVDKPNGSLNLPLDVQGTAFQHRVWRALSEIPGGATATYSQIAQRIGSPKAVRAVAAACAANPVAVAVPCHRVVRNDGALAGYRWGIERKRALLDKEARAGAKKPGG